MRFRACAITTTLAVTGLAHLGIRVRGSAALKRSAQLEPLTSPSWQRPQAGALSLKFPLPRQAVSLVTLRW